MSDKRTCRAAVLALFAGCLILVGSFQAAFAEDPPSREEILRRIDELEKEKKKLLEMLEKSKEAPELPAPVAEEAPAEKETPPEPEPEPEGEDASRPAVMKQVVIIANRYEVDADRVTSSVERFDRDDMERRQVPRVQEVLNESPGVRVLESGPPGQFAGIFIRGAASTHTLVLIDGIPVNNAGFGVAFDFTGLSSSGIESVEVLRGSYGLVYGSAAIGGVVSMETRRGEGKPNGWLLFDGGSFYTHHEALGFGGSDGGFDYNVTLSNYRTKGERHYEKYRSTDFFGRFGIELGPRTRVDTTVLYTDSKTQNPLGWAPPGNPLPEEENSETGLDRFAVGMNVTSDLTDWLTARLHGSLLETQSTWDNGPNEPYQFDPDGEPDTGDEYEAYMNQLTSENDQLDYRVRASLTAYLNDVLKIRDREHGGLDLEMTLGGEYVHQETRDHQIYPNEAETTQPTDAVAYIDGDTHTSSVYLHAEFALPDLGPFHGGVLNVGNRWDEHSEAGHVSSSFAGARVLFEPTDTEFHATYGEGFRTPLSTSLYDPFFGNPDLEPESSKSYDVGVVQYLFDRRVMAAVTWFKLDIDDRIIYDWDTGRLGNADGGVRSTGFEYQLLADLGSGFTVRGAYTAQNPREVDTGEARDIWRFGSAGLSWERGPFLASLDAVFSNGFHNRGGEYPYPEGEEREHPGRKNVVNLAARYRLNDGLTFFGRVENLTDDDYVAGPTSPAGLPLGVYFGAELELR